FHEERLSGDPFPKFSCAEEGDSFESGDITYGGVNTKTRGAPACVANPARTPSAVIPPRTEVFQEMNKGQVLTLHCVLLLLALVAFTSMTSKAAVAEESPGAVYVLTNQTTNSVMVYARDADGALSFAGSFTTGGMGAGTGADPLGSQGSLVLGRFHRLLFAVNAGSNE